MTQTEWILSLFPPDHAGYFVEAGAHDGVGDSNTKALEDLGWQGICVEPSSAFAGLAKARKCHVDGRCLWNVDGGEVLFRECLDDIELSGIEQAFVMEDNWDRQSRKSCMVRKRTVTLTTLLAEYGAPRVIEYLSLDVEGAELAVLSAHDFGRYLFLAVTVEHNRVVERRDAIRDLLAGHGYRLHPDNTWDVEDWFVHESTEWKPWRTRFPLKGV